MNTLPATDANVMSSLQAAFAQQATSPAHIERLTAWQRFVARGIPTTRDELWKYTNLQRFNDLKFAVPAANSAINLNITRSDEFYLMTFVNGFFATAQSTMPTLPGLRITTASDIGKETNAPNESSFVALNAALTQDAVLIEIDANVTVDKPLYLQFIIDTTVNAMVHPRVMLRAGSYSKLTVLEHYSSEGEIAHFTNAVTQISLAEGAQLEHCRIQRDNLASFHIGMLHAEIAVHAKLISHQYNLGGALGRVDINVLLNGKQAHAELNGLQFASDAQHHDTHTLIEHRVPHASSTEDYRGIADQRGRVVFNGKVLVHKKAIGTDAQQSSRNLLLSAKAEIDTKPELEIYADDVKCAHGATVGQLDTNALFYLRSRGIEEKQARGMLTLAFADAVINRVPIAELRDELTQAVHARFSTALDVTT